SNLSQRHQRAALPLSAAREKSKTLFTTIGAEDEVDLSPTAQVAGHKRTFCDVRVMRFTPESGHQSNVR
ncbi:MAG: hypothetical protein WAM03_24600, partial [Pseudolabrys sp.]